MNSSDENSALIAHLECREISHFSLKKGGLDAILVRMALSIKESRAISDIAELLSDYLPGSGNPLWKGHVSYLTIAQKIGVGDFWQPGTKLNMIKNLLERTLEIRRYLFENLIKEIVLEGIMYRKKNNNPVKRAEIETLNGFLLEVSFKFPELWDITFLDSLEDSAEKAKQNFEQVIKEQEIEASKSKQQSTDLLKLKNEFLNLSSESDRQGAGRSLQRILQELFSISNLDPRTPFRVIGEEIDGAFELDHESYLVEAMWEKLPIAEKHLLEFRGKIEGKSKFTRGIFISINGYTEQAKDAIIRGKESLFFGIDGYDLCMILHEDIDLIQFLRIRRRLLGEKGLVFVPYEQLTLHKKIIAKSTH
ncbi:MAG: restriction endonuclease [Candidatus Zixiibacteriota bacterium]